MTSVSRVGFVSATGLCLVGIVYIAVVSVGVSEAGLIDPIADPVLEWPSAGHLLSRVLWR